MAAAKRQTNWRLRVLLVAIFGTSVLSNFVTLKAAIGQTTVSTDGQATTLPLRNPLPRMSAPSKNEIQKNQTAQQKTSHIQAPPSASSSEVMERLLPVLNQSGQPVAIKGQVCGHVPIPQRFPNLSSSIEYSGCCGLGHRLARMATAAHVSAALRIPLFGWWGCCNQDDVFATLFGPEPLLVRKHGETRAADIAQQFSPQQQHFQFRYDVPGPIFGQYKGRRKKKTTIQCPARPSKIATDYAFYALLRERYQRKHVVNAFVKKHFEGKFVIGLHLRAGNGELGDFHTKRRYIGKREKDSFFRHVVTHIRTLLASHQSAAAAAVLFVATDTPDHLATLQSALNGSSKISVVDAPQVRLRTGTGVFFGAMDRVQTQGGQCLDGWHGALTDALLLSHVDVVYAPKPSAFAQSLPLSLVMGPNRTVQAPFCESRGPTLKCYESIQQWSCETLDPKPCFLDTLPQYSFL